MTSLKDNIEACGVVGCGGAGFPTHVKAASKAPVLIANGAECEPLVSSDLALMTHYSKDMIEGLRLLGDAVGARELVIAIKEKNRPLLDIIGEHRDIQIKLLGNYYPAGDEVSMVYEVTGKIPPEGGIPLDVGVLVQNVTTLAKISEANKGIPFTSRLVTVSGHVNNPVTVEAPIGTYLSDLIKAAGGATSKPFAMVVGGPCMGEMAPSLKSPVEKTTSGVLLLPPEHPLVQLKTVNPDRMLRRARSVCDLCRECTDLCPRYLLGHDIDPQRLMTHVAWGNKMNASQLKIAHLCCECGICGLYACPSGLLPYMYIRRIKEELLKSGQAREKGVTPMKPRPEFFDRKLPASRLEARLQLNRYTDKAPLCPDPIKPKEVKILLKQHVGAPCKLLVKPGQTVKQGDPIGKPPKGALGARIHASISGEVKEVTQHWVILRAQT